MQPSKRRRGRLSLSLSFSLCLSSTLVLPLSLPPPSLFPSYLSHSPCQSVPPSPSLPDFLPSLSCPPPPPPPLSPSVSLCHWRASQCENAILLSRLLPLSGCGGKRLVCVCISVVCVPFFSGCLSIAVCVCIHTYVCCYQFAGRRTFAFFNPRCF